MILLLVCHALAHGGEDHGAPPPARITADATRVSVATSSQQFEAVLRVAKGPAGSPVAATLLLDDYATSAPIADATPSLTLSGPATVTIPFTPGAPGTYTATATFPADGDYAGALVVTTPRTSDLLAISGLHLGPPSADAQAGGTQASGAQASGTPGGPAAASSTARLVGGIAGIGLIGAIVLVSVGIGYLFGRRRAAGAAMLLGAIFGARRGLAHGGEDHGGAVAGVPADPSGALTLPMESQFLVGLRTSRLVHDAFREEVPVGGRFVARPGASATLRAPVAGELVAPPGGFPAPGTTVRAGQLLGTVREPVGSADRAALAQQRQQAANAVAEATKALTLAERDAAQAEGLGAGISERERLDRRQSVEVAKTALAEAQRALAAIGDGSGVTVRAPVDGRLGAALARPGDQIQAGDPLFRVVDASGLWMEARVPERIAPQVLAGAPARVFATAFPGAPLGASVLDAGQEADPTTGTLTATLAVDPAGHALRPGMSATAWIGRGPPRDVLVVPDAAVVDSNGVSLGFVKVGPERFELRELRLGARSGEVREVLDGLRVGERVVTDGTYALRSLAGR